MEERRIGLSYQEPDKQKWSGRIDPVGTVDTFYWHQIVRCMPISELPKTQSRQIAFLGYQSDEGVKRNSGRVGAVEGPNAMRSALSKMALHFNPNDHPISDVGDVVTDGSNLEDSQMELADQVDLLLSNGYLPIVLGGGHEISYGHYGGIRKFLGDRRKIGVINLDAHFDLRSYPNGPHSGSPFRQILDDCTSSGNEFNYLPIGINPAGNQKVLFDVHHDAGQQLILQRDLEKGIQTSLDQIDTFINSVDHLYLTLDLDVMPAAYAPGVSAPAAFGVDPQVIRELIHHVFSTKKVISFDIAELSPRYDDGRTAKLAASFVYDIIMEHVVV